jgi:coronin-1B/1C/6
VAFLEGTSRVVTVGFTRAAKRQMKIWDVSDLSTPLASLDIDQSAGVMMPFYDADTKLLYLAGKGDGNIRYYEMVDSAPWFYNIDEFRSGVSQKGIAMCPKRGYNVPRCEIARFLKLTSKGTVDPVSFIVPRKSECFQDDIYPDAISGEPALSADAWFGGENKPAKRMSMDPAARGASGGEGKPAAFKFTPMKPAIEIQKELDTANARIAELEAEIAALKLEA